MTGYPTESVQTITRGINLMLYSENGVGKTPLLGTGERTLILDADNGAESAALWGKSTARKRIVTSWDDLDDCYEYLRHTPDHPFKWVWLDSVSTFQEIGLFDDIMPKLVAVKSHRKVYHADKGDYGENMARLKIWVRKMAGLPVNFGMTAHPFRGEDVSGDVMYAPFIQGKNMVPTICSYMNVIGYLTKVERQGKTYQVLYTGPHPDLDMYMVRDRFNALGGRMISPTIPKIQSAIEAKIKEANARNRRPAVAKKATRPVKKAGRRTAVPTTRRMA